MQQDTISLCALFIPLYVDFIYSKFKNITISLIKVKARLLYSRGIVKVLGHVAARWHNSQTRKAVYEAPFPSSGLGAGLL